MISLREGSSWVEDEEFVIRCDWAEGQPTVPPPSSQSPFSPPLYIDRQYLTNTDNKKVNMSGIQTFFRVMPPHPCD